MLAYRAEKGARCQMCGTAEWEWDPKQGGNKFAYEPIAHTCPGCAAKDILQQGDDSDKRPGTTIILRPTRTVEWARSMLKRQRRQQRGRG